jgi:acyl-coenzyme A thioesterase 13
MDEDARRRFAELFGAGYERSLAGLALLEVAGGRARMRLPVGAEVANVNGHLHGGALATLVDVAGTIAIIAADRSSRPGVTTDLNVSYFAATPSGDAAIAEARALKIGRSLGFVEVELRRESDGVLVAQGRMTKHLG